jgi:hypothetical protein
MPNITTFIPDDLYEKMKEYEDVNWVNIIIDSIKTTISELKNHERRYTLSRITSQESAEELFEFELNKIFK